MPLTKRLEQIVIRDNWIKKGGEIKADYDVIGLDTETDKGYATLISNNRKDYKIIYDLNDLLEFLLIKKHRENINFFFNLTYDMDAILKYLPREKLSEICEYGYTNINSKVRGPITIERIPGKCLKFISGWNKGRKVWKFFDIAHFYQLGSLADTYTQVFNKPYVKRCDASKERFKQQDITEEKIKYCIEDSIICQLLAEDIVNLSREFVQIRNFYSPASLSKAIIKKNLINDYKFKPEPIQAAALMGFYGGRFETIQRGYFDGNNKVYGYDVVSAYPSIAAKLYYPKGVREHNKEFEDKSIYSFFKVKLEIDENIIEPLRYKQKHIGITYPSGLFEHKENHKDEYVVLDLNEYKLLEKIGYKIDILDAYHILNPEPTYAYPWINDLFNKRKELKENGIKSEYIIKIILNSLFGVQIQTTPKYDLLETLLNEDTDLFSNVKAYCNVCEETIMLDFNNGLCPRCNSIITGQWWARRIYAGDFFNPLFASTITSGIRCKIYEDSYKYAKNVLLYATDGIYFNRSMPKLKIGNNLGDYEYEGKYHGLIFGSGIYTLECEDKKNKDGSVKIKNRYRGQDQKENVFELLNKHKQQTEIKVYKKRPEHLKECKDDFSRLNVWTEKEKRLMINSDKKRNWDWKPKNFGELLKNVITSKPLSI